MSKVIFSKDAITGGLRGSEAMYAANGTSKLMLNGKQVYALGSSSSTNLFVDVAGGAFATNAVSFALFKGALPTQSELDTAFRTAVTPPNPPTFRSEDALIRYRTSASSGDLKPFTTIGFDGATCMYAPPPATAIQSGTATWFAFMGLDCSDILVGTVSSAGGGGEMQLLEVDLISGQTYSMPPWMLSIPKILSY